MRNYELVAIMKPDMEKENYEEIKEKVSAAIAKNEGEVKSWNFWKEKQRFSYTLRARSADKKKYDEGTYVLSEIFINPLKIGALKYVLDLEERIIRYLIINKDAK